MNYVGIEMSISSEGMTTGLASYYLESSLVWRTKLITKMCYDENTLSLGIKSSISINDASILMPWPRQPLDSRYIR